MKKLIIIIICFQFGFLFSQEEDRERIVNEANQLIASGNTMLVQNGNFPKAEGEYRKAIAKNPVDPTAKYNLANAYYNSAKYDEATHRYTEAAKVASAKTEKHKAFHNKGNTFMEQKKYKEAVEAYKNALRNNPKDDETRYNLALAKKMLEQQQNDQNQDDQNKDQDKDQNQDNKDQKEGDDKEDKKGDEGEKEKEKGGDQKDKGDEGEDKKEEGDKEKDDKGQPKDEQKGEGEDKKDEQGEPKEQPQRPQGQLSPERVKSLLEAMNNQEKKVQDKINAKKAQGQKVKTDKDW